VWLSEDSLGETIGTDLDVLFSRRALSAGAAWDEPLVVNQSPDHDEGYDRFIGISSTNDALVGLSVSGGFNTSRIQQLEVTAPVPVEHSDNTFVCNPVTFSTPVSLTSVGLPSSALDITHMESPSLVSMTEHDALFAFYEESGGSISPGDANELAEFSVYPKSTLLVVRLHRPLHHLEQTGPAHVFPPHRVRARRLPLPDRRAKR